MTAPASSARLSSSPSADELRGIASALRAACERIEGTFVGVGAGLSEAAGTIERLTSSFAGLHRELVGAGVEDATRCLHDMAREAASLAGALEEEAAALDRLLGLATAVGAGIGRLRTTVGAISALAVNARVVATHIAGHGEEFAVFTSEIGRLANTAKGSIDRFAEEHERLIASLAAARAEQSGFATRHGKALQTVVRKLEGSLDSVARQKVEAAAAAADIESRSRRIAGDIGTAVMALQIGDITRQRVEHAVEALMQAASGDLPGERLDERQADALAAIAAGMQAAQLDHAAGEFAREAARVDDALRRLAGEADAIVRQGTSVFGGGNSSERSFLVTLADDLDQAARLIDGSAAARAAVDRVAAAVTDTLNELLSQMNAVRRVEIDMRLVGLNTTFKCARLGEQGRALNVIAQELRSYANRTVEDAQEVASGLGTIAEAATRLKGGADGQGAGRITELEAASAAAVRALRVAGTTLDTALDALGRDGERMTATLRAALAGLTEREAIVRALGGAQSGLRGLREPADLAPDERVRLHDRLAALSRHRFTMQSERAVQDGGAAADDGGSLDDVLF